MVTTITDTVFSRIWCLLRIIILTRKGDIADMTIDELFEITFDEKEKKEFIEELKVTLEKKNELFEEELRNQVLDEAFLNRSYNI